MLLFKLVTGAVCLADGAYPTSVPNRSVIESATYSAVAESTHLDETACRLGETGGCHCACAHAVPLAHAIASDAGGVGSGFEPAFLSSGYLPAPPGSLLRPPIA